MSFQFKLRHANIVAYLTHPGQPEPPRLLVKDLRDFCGAIAEDREILSNWNDQIRELAAEKQQFLGQRYEFRLHERLGEEETRDALQRLRGELRGFRLYALAVSAIEDSALRRFMLEAGKESGPDGLYLIPSRDQEARRVELLDPFPQISRLANDPGAWPGVLFWSGRESAFVSFREAERLNGELLAAAKESEFSVQAVLRAFRRRTSSVRLLHLSDLHFGSDYAVAKSKILKERLRQEQFDRVVITGDLFDSPKGDAAKKFRAFDHELQRISNKPVSVIPGNHDQKVRGNSLFGFGVELREAVDLEWSSVVVDEKGRLVLFCFNSGIDAHFARGRVTENQLKQVAVEFKHRCALDPRIESFLRVALVHHHPFSWDAKAETFIQRALRLFGMADERFLAMEESERFVAWCVARQIPLILHGHKHLQRHVVRTFGDRMIDSIGCGTSLGAEKLPQTYNVLAWEPATRRWGVTFYEYADETRRFESRALAIDNA